MYDIDKYYQAVDVDDAVRALSKDPEAVVISGGSDVLIKIREGKLAGCSLVSIHGIKELEGIRVEEDGTIAIGPATTFSHITNNQIIQDLIPILGDAVDMAGGPQLRNIGTVGGNVCNGVTSADSASSFCCLNAVLVLKGPEGIREVPISQWYTGPGRTVRKHEEVLVSIRIKNKQHIADLRLAYGVAAPTPIRCHETEQSVIGMELGEALAEKVGRGALLEVNPRSSWRASKEFRLQLVEELGKRAVRQAAINAGGEWDA